MSQPQTTSAPQTATPKAKRRWRLGPVWLELFLFLLVSLLAAAVLMAASPTGTRGLFALLTHLTDGMIRVAQVEGTLWGELRLQGVQIKTETEAVRLDSAVLRWQPAQLLVGRVAVDALVLGNLDIRTQPSTSPTEVPDALDLPLALRVRSATVGKVVVDGMSVLQSASLTLESTGTLHQLTVQQARTPWFDGRGQLQLAGIRPFKLHGELKMTGSAEGAPWQAGLQLSESLESLRLAGQAQGGPVLDKPFRARYDLRLAPFSRSAYGILKAGEVATEAMDLRVLSASLPRTALDVQLQARPARCSDARVGSQGQEHRRAPCREEAVAVSLQLSNPLAGNWPAGRLPLRQASASLRLDTEHLWIERLNASLAEGELGLAGTATLDQLDIKAVLSKLNPAAFGGPAWPISGQLALSGSPQAPLLQGEVGDGRLTLAMDLGLVGELPAHKLVAKQLILKAAEGSLALTGELGLAGKQSFKLTGKLAGMDPQVLAKLVDYPLPAGQINADITAAGQLSAPMALTFKADIAPSRFNGQPLQGEVAADWRAAAVLQRVRAALTLGPNRLNAHGDFGLPGNSLRLDIQMPDVGDFGKGFNGRLEAQLNLSGTLQRPSLEGMARSEQLRLPGDIAIGNAVLAARLDAAPDKPASSPLMLKLDVTQLTAPKLALNRARLQISGTQAAHTVELDGAGKLAEEDFELLLKGGGSLDNQQWRGQITALENKGVWPMRLNMPAQLQVARDGGAVHGLDAVALGAKIRVQRGEWHHGGRFSAQGDMRDVALAEWLERLPEFKSNLSTDLVLAARFDLQGDEKLAGSLVLERQTGDLALLVDDPTIKPMPLKLSSAKAQLDLAGDKAALALDLKSASFGSASGRISTRFERTEQGWRPAAGAALEGKLQAEMPSLGWVGPLLGPAAKVEGKLSAEVAAGGHIGAPSWFGRLSAKDVALRLPDSGIYWREGQLDATLDGDTAQLSALSLKAGKGEMTASGRMSLRDTGPEGSLLVKFAQFGALTRPDRNLVVSGETALGVQGEALTLTGKLAADEGLIELPRGDAPTLGDDVIVKGREAPDRKRSKAPPITLRLDLDLGRKFVFKGQGVDARLSGLVRIAASPTQNLSASGALKVDEGRYAAYGQNLAISRGIITFQGPLDNPALDILAERKNLPVVVGVKIVGTALAPRVSLVSNDAMSDAEKLSWLVLGRGSAAGGGDADLLLTAADALFTAGDSVGLRQQMAGRLGLDDISIGRSDSYTKDEGEGGALSGRVVSLGKRVSDKAYVSYEQSLDGVGYAVKLTYQLTRRISVALTAGQSSAADLLYSWTFD